MTACMQYSRPLREFDATFMYAGGFARKISIYRLAVLFHPPCGVSPVRGRSLKPFLSLFTVSLSLSPLLAKVSEVESKIVLLQEENEVNVVIKSLI